MDKIAPDLLEVLNRREREHAEAVARNDHAAMALVDAPIQVLVSFDGPPDALVAAGFPIGGLVSHVAQGGLSPAQIRGLAQLPFVHSVRLPVIPNASLDVSVPEILAKDAWAVGVPPADEGHGKGEGVIVGIIDSGIDVFHGAFRNLDNTSRILRLWDQTFDYHPTTGAPVDSKGTPITGDLTPRDETGAVLTPARAPTDLRVPADSGRPKLFTNGAQFDTSQINAALTAHPDGKGLPISLRDQPVFDGAHDVHHGTHVAGIAAGNGAQNDKCTSPFTYVGVAPKADIVVVKTSVGGGQPNRISNIVEAAEYIFRVAARQNPPSGKPCVINISLGTHFGPHNGYSGTSRSFDAMTAGPLGVGRCIVISAGNDRHLDLHAAFTVAKGSHRTVQVNLKAGVRRLALFGSYNPAATLTCEVRMQDAPPAERTAPLPINVSNAEVNIGTLPHKALVAWEPSAPADPDSHFSVTVSNASSNLPKGVWEFDLAASAAGADANVHLWIAAPGGYDSAFVPFPGAVASVQDAGRDVKRPAEWIAATLNAYATTRSAITVAAYDAEESGGPLAEFSAQGPGPNNLSAGLLSPADAIPKPDIAAPGMHIDAPRGEARRCCLECECCVDRYVAEQGTSMASPHIAGVIALMFARNPSLTPDEIRQRLRDKGRAPPTLPPGWPPSADLWGAGRVDAKAAVEASVVPRAAPEADMAPEALVVPEPQFVPVGWPQRLRGWSDILGHHPAWNLCAALVSQHFDEVKRLIDTNRRVAALWQRSEGPALVRGIAFAEHLPDPPLPSRLAAGRPRGAMTRLLTVLARYGGEALRADVVRYAPLVLALPGASWNELDDLVNRGYA